jgi:hypothetical protein
MSPDINSDCLVKEFIDLGASNSTRNPPPPTDPLLGLTIYTVAAVAAVAASTTTRMDDMNERVDDDDPPCDASEGDGFLNEIWDCPYFNENVKIPDPLNEGCTNSTVDKEGILQRNPSRNQNSKHTSNFWRETKLFYGGMGHFGGN